MVSAPDTDASGVQENVDGVQGREAGGVGNTRRAQERRQERFEPGARGGRCARVDVCVERLRPLCGVFVLISYAGEVKGWTWNPWQEGELCEGHSLP